MAIHLKDVLEQENLLNLNSNLDSKIEFIGTNRSLEKEKKQPFPSVDLQGEILGTTTSKPYQFM